MDVPALKAQIKSNKLDNLYIFTGTEWAVQKIYIQQIGKVSKKSIQYVDDVLTVYKSCQKKSLVVVSSLYVVLDDEQYLKEEKLQDRIKDVLKDDILILVYTKADKRKKIFKDAVEFEPLKPEVLKKYLKKSNVALQENRWNKLIEVCEGDYGRCLLETDKINRFGKYMFEEKHLPVSDDDTFDLFIETGIIYQSPKDAIFDFVDAVLRRDVKNVFDLLEQSKAVGENTMTFLSVLYNNVKAVLVLQLCKGKDAAKTSGIDNRQLYYARQKTGYYNNGDLIYMMKQIQKMQEGIVTGQIEEQFVMDYLLVNVL